LLDLNFNFAIVFNFTQNKKKNCNFNFISKPNKSFIFTKTKYHLKMKEEEEIDEEELQNSMDIKLYRTLAKKKKQTLRPTIIKEIKEEMNEESTEPIHYESTNMRASEGHLTITKRFNVRVSMFVRENEKSTETEAEDNLFETLWRNSDLSCVVNNATKLMSHDIDFTNKNKEKEEQKKVRIDKNIGTINATSFKQEMWEFKKENQIHNKKKNSDKMIRKRDVLMPRLNSQMELKDLIKNNKQMKELMNNNLAGKRLFGRKLEEIIKEKDQVTLFLEICFEELKKNGLTEKKESLLLPAIDVDPRLFSNLCSRLNMGDFDSLKETNNFPFIALILQKWLNELPNPCIPHITTEFFVSVLNSHQSSKAKIRVAHTLINFIPKRNKIYFGVTKKF
jgi:hypothetical protein